MRSEVQILPGPPPALPTGSAAATAVCASKQRKPILQLLPSTLGLLRNACRGGVCCANTGGVAQLGERLLCKQEVDGSSPFTSTTDESAAFIARRLGLSRRQGFARANPERRKHGLERGSGTELAPKLLYWEGGVGC